MTLDHLVISTQDLKRSVRFYSAFLGKAKIGKEDAHWQLGDTKLFITFPYSKSAKKFNKQNLGLNHLALRCKDLIELKRYAQKLTKAHIAHSGVQLDTYSKKEFVYFDDPDGIRLEFYVR